MKIGRSTGWTFFSSKLVFYPDTVKSLSHLNWVILFNLSESQFFIRINFHLCARECVWPYTLIDFNLITNKKVENLLLKNSLTILINNYISKKQQTHKAHTFKLKLATKTEWWRKKLIKSSSAAHHKHNRKHIENKLLMMFLFILLVFCFYIGWCLVHLHWFSFSCMTLAWIAYRFTKSEKYEREKAKKSLILWRCVKIESEKIDICFLIFESLLLYLV